MAVDHFALHRALTSTPDARRAELRSARSLSGVFGVITIAQAVLAQSWAAGVLIIPCVLIEFALRTTELSRSVKFCLAAAISAGFAEIAVALSIFVERIPRIGTLILGAIIGWIAFRSLRTLHYLHRMQARPLIPVDHLQL